MNLFKQTKNTGIILASAFFFNLALLNNIYSQSPERYLQINGTAELDMKPVSNAIVTLYENNAEISSVKTGSSGLFSFKLEMNKDYVIEIAKKGYIPKRIRFITNIPDEETGIWVREFAVGLVKYCEGINYSVLNEPVDVIKYSVKRKDFDSDKTFVYKAKPRLENLYMEVDQCITDKYNKALDEADKLLEQKKYDEAKSRYEEAQEIYPNEEYPGEQINKIADMITKDMNIDNLYNNTISEADALYAQGRYDEALIKYKGAMMLKPQEMYSKQKISEIESHAAKLEAEQQAKSDADTKYNNLILKGNSAMAEKNYELAKQLYSQAQEIKPANNYPANKIQEIDVLVSQKAQAEAKQQEQVREYTSKVSQADRLLQEQNYEAAKAAYQNALAANPQELYPRQKIAEIDNLIKERQEAQVQAKRDALDKEYQAALAEGDNFFNLKEYDAAKTAYNMASNIKPNELYPRQRIEKINSLIAAEQASKQQALNKAYSDAIAAGENYVAAKQYDLAKQEYNKALSYKPDDYYAKNRLSEIERLAETQRQQLAADKARNEQYQAAIAKADGLFKMLEFDAAKTAYQAAININPAEQYPRGQVQEIDRLLAIKKAEKEREMEAGYKSSIISGNRLFTNNQYALARDEYEKALGYKPGDLFATNRISEVNRLLSEAEQKAAAEQARKKQYDDLIAKADGLKNSKDYSNAKLEYNRALQIFPEEVYPKQQITEIDRLLREQEQVLADRKVKENSYNMAISKGDGYFRLEEYEKAKAEYYNALLIMPDEIYPRDKINEIDGIVQAQLKAQADAKAKNDAYNSSVTKADNLFAQKKYNEARTGYTAALNYKPDASYPKEQISKIDDILAEQESTRQAQLARDREYQSIIAVADRAFDAADYNNAKTSYEKALDVKSDELYPKQKIARINDILELLAKQEKTSKSYQSQAQSQTSAGTASKPKLADLNFKDDNERDRYLAGLKTRYPEGITLETYAEKFKITKRYVIIRQGMAHEFRMVHFTSWGGKEYSVDGKPITGQYFESQISPRSGEYYKEFEF
jgi:tetratricopeptide (TPR) repeat protein